MNRQRGFTLMEMLVAIGLMLVVSAIATPVASTIFNRYEFTSTVEQLAFEIARARMQAVGQNTPVRIRLTTGGYVREFDALNNNVWAQSEAPVVLPSGITATGGTPVFNRNGIAPQTTNIIVSGNGQQRTIRTSVVGRVTIS
jgi:prepilin-type N-terminal cleavage/methylation domain-containing protein